MIKSVVIKRFRSFGQVEIDAAQLNIFSGKNNTGKSNILRALNLFFNSQSNYNIPYNHAEDYNKAFRGAAGGKREIQIEIKFAGVGNGALKDDFYVCRTFSEGASTPETHYRSTNTGVNAGIQTHNGNVIRQFTAFLNKIEYLYIPAVRDKVFMHSILLRFEQIIRSAAKGDQFNEAIGNLSAILHGVSKGISLNFSKYMQMPATASLSSNTTDVLGAIEINVDTGLQIQNKKSGKEKARIKNVPISLFASGDGVVMAYLVHFLAFLTMNDKRSFIWGFEEPENSLEFSKVEELANQFYSDFSKQAQVFITTHSPAFINLHKKDNVLLYRVYVEPQSPNDDEKNLPNKCLTRVEKLDTIAQQLSLLNFDDPRYAVLDNELHLTEQSEEIERIAQTLRKERKQLAQEKQEFERKNAHLLQNYPNKIFICEDECGVELWEHLFREAGISGVSIISSSGCCNNQVENWAALQKHYRSDYAPIIFREIDRDGMLDDQAKVICTHLIDKFKNRFAKYDVGILPVYEIENFAILCDENLSMMPPAYHDIEPEHLLAIDRHFAAAAHAKLNQLLRMTDDKDTFPGTTSTSCEKKINEMLKDAASDFTRLMPGKEVAKIIEGFRPISFLQTLSLDGFPSSLSTYLAQVKNFFSES